MTAKEKAEELFDKMAFEVCGTDAKICALIAVDEIIKTEYEIVKKLLDIILSNNIRIVMSVNEGYWEEVKHEIKQL